jgi:hypothetical protein
VAPGLARTLDAFEPPFAYLDFETVSPPVPAWPGCRPCEHVPVQFACFAPGPRGRLRRHEFLAAAGRDPRPDLARLLLLACRRARTVFAYYASFERACLLHLADHVPTAARGLRAIEARIADLHPVVRDHVYHPRFAGRFGIKSVLPVLVPALSYDDLSIRSGDVAAAHLEHLLLLEPLRDDRKRTEVRTDLLRYCRRDAQGLVALHRWLRDHA